MNGIFVLLERLKMQQKKSHDSFENGSVFFSLDDELLKEMLYILVTIFGEILVGDD